MSFTSYAQNFEDVMLWRALGHVQDGFYIDIGAQDPVVDSVSLAFHEHGWKGVHIEPVPMFATSLSQQRPGDTVIQAAVSNKRSVMKFYEIPDTGISTGDAQIAAQHRARGFVTREISVPCLTLASVFDLIGDRDVHWLKIDVEGLERQVLASWGKAKARPWVVVVESVLPLTRTESSGDWSQLLVKRGYTHAYFDGLNRFFVSHSHPELQAAFELPPNIFDDFSLNGTASAPFQRTIDSRCQERLELTRSTADERVRVAGSEVAELAEKINRLTQERSTELAAIGERESRLAAHVEKLTLERGLLAKSLDEQRNTQDQYGKFVSEQLERAQEAQLQILRDLGRQHEARESLLMQELGAAAERHRITQGEIDRLRLVIETKQDQAAEQVGLLHERAIAAEAQASQERADFLQVAKDLQLAHADRERFLIEEVHEGRKAQALLTKEFEQASALAEKSFTQQKANLLLESENRLRQAEAGYENRHALMTAEVQSLRVELAQLLHDHEAIVASLERSRLDADRDRAVFDAHSRQLQLQREQLQQDATRLDTAYQLLIETRFADYELGKLLKERVSAAQQLIRQIH